MQLPAILDRLLAMPVRDVPRGAPWDPAALVVKPHFGKIRWAPPPSYRALAAAGLRGATREVELVEARRGFTLLTPATFTGVNADLVHMPAGVSREPDVELSTNHLVGFAEAEGEAVWCFDVSQPAADGEYPVYYHHQDEPRARILATGAWEEPTEPDFESLAQWLETMTAALVAEDPPDWLADLGRPGLTFVTTRLTL